MKNMEKDMQNLINIEPLTNQNIELADLLLSELLKEIDVCSGIPIISIFTSIHKSINSIYEYKMYRRLLYFYQGCKEINSHEKEKFLKKIKEKEAETGYRMILLLERLDVDEKAELIGKLYVYCVENQYDMLSYFRICRCVEKCFYEDLQYLEKWSEKDTICAQNTDIPQEIIESLYNDGLLLECGIDGGGFKEDEETGVMYSLNLYGKIIANLLRKNINE